MADDPADPTLSRRRLFELTAGSLGVAAVVAACGSEAESPAPGRIGNAPVETALATLAVNDVVYLRTLTSLEHSIVEVYSALAALDGLDAETASLLGRFVDDHVAAAGSLATLTTEAGGEPYECPNPWMMDRTLQPLLDHIVGVTDGESEIAATDDPTRDSLSTAYALEATAAATAQLYVERLSDPAMRPTVITAGTGSSRRAAAAALRSNPPLEGYVSPALTSGDAVGADAQGFLPVFAVSSRYGQLTPIELQVGATDDVGQRYLASLTTPAENAYVYEGMTCQA